MTVRQALQGASLLVQVCLAAVMAQVGAWVPAESLTLSPVDAAFVRMGAKVNFGPEELFWPLQRLQAAIVGQMSTAQAAACGVSLHWAAVPFVAWELEQSVSNEPQAPAMCSMAQL